MSFFQNIRNSSALQTVINAGTGFTIVGLVSAIVFLIANGVAVLNTLKEFPVPEIKTFAITGFNDGPARVYIDIEFPGRNSGNFISAQTEGSFEFLIFISENGVPLPEKPSVSITIPNGLNLNLAAKEPSRFVIDDLKINFSESFNAEIISKMLTAKIFSGKIPENLVPNVAVRVKTQAVFKSLWIPVGGRIDLPYDVTEIVLKEIKKMNAAVNSVDIESEKVEELTQDAIKENESEIKGKKDDFESEKEKVKREFSYKPRLVKVLASDADKLEITAVAAIPAALIPSFLYIEVPRTSFDIGFYELGHEKEQNVMNMINFSTESFLLQPATIVDVSKEILISASLKIESKDLSGLQTVLRLIRDDKMDKIGIQVKQEDKFVKNLNKGALMHWLKKFVLNIPLGEMLEKKKLDDREKERAEISKNGAESETEVKAQSRPQDETQANKVKPMSTEILKELIKNQVASFKLLATKKDGTFVFQTRFLRSFASNFIGSIPVLELVVELPGEIENHGGKLVQIKLISPETKPDDEFLEINIEFSVLSLRKLVYLGLRASKAGNKNMHEKIPEIKRIESVDIKFDTLSESIISKLASIFNVKVFFNDENGVDKIIFQESSIQLYPNVKKEEERVKERSLPSSHVPQVSLKEKMKKELDTKFSIKNGVDSSKKVLEIETSLNLAESRYEGDFVRLSWENFSLSILHDHSSLMTFKIYQGLVNIGITGGIDPFSASFAAGITIPAENDPLSNLKNVLKKFTKSTNDIIVLDFEIKYGEGDLEAEAEAEGTKIKMDAVIPCMQMLKPDDPPKSEDSESKEDKGKEKDSSIETESHPNPVIESDPLKTPVEPERTDFIGKVKNSIISFVSFQASTLFFHVTYPDGHYCPNEIMSDFDLKINFDIALPMIDANVCTSELNDGETTLHCFASAGISRPMTFSTVIIDGQICQVESAVLSEEAYSKLTGLNTVKKTTEIRYDKNEIPIHVAIKDLAAFIGFATKIGKKDQFITVGRLDDTSSVNRVIGEIVSATFSYTLPETATKAQTPNPVVPVEEAAPKRPDFIVIQVDPTNHGTLEIKTKSPNNNELIIAAGFSLPEASFEGVPIADKQFNWPALRWGRFKYNFGIKDVFDMAFSVERGQIDIQKDGIVPFALQNAAIRIHLTVNEKYPLGSTALRQMLGTFLQYFESEAAQQYELKNIVFDDTDKNTNTFFYSFYMKGPRGLNDASVFSAEGEVPLKDIISLGKAAYGQIPKTEPKLHDNSGEVEAQESVDESKAPNFFDGTKIKMKTVSKRDFPNLKFPCLIPTLCSEDATLNPSDAKIQDRPLDLVFEVENVLGPATKLIGSKIGPILEKFKLVKYPSHIQLKFASLSDLWITFMLNGAGLASVGLIPFKFERTQLMIYSKEIIRLVPEANSVSIDKFEIGLKLNFPDTLTGLRSTLSIFRRESLMLAPIVPVFYEQNQFGYGQGYKKTELSNAPFHIALSSDDQTRGNNMISALIATLLEEQIAPAINPSDETLKELFEGEIRQPEKPKDKAKEVEVEIKKDESMETEMGTLDILKSAYIGSCLLFGKNCDTQLDLSYNLKLPFANNLIKFVLPGTSIIRFFVDDAPIIQFVADARKQKQLQISSETGVDLLGTANVCFAGLDNVSENIKKKIGSNIYDHIFKNEKILTPFKLQVILGHDIDLSAELYFPMYKLQDIIKAKFTTLVKSYLSKIPGVNSLGNLFSWFFSKPQTENCGTSELDGLICSARRERRQCILPNSQSTNIADLDYGKSVIFYEKGAEVLTPGKKVKLYLQLRTSEDKVFCGNPIGTPKVSFIREESKQGFIKVMDLFAYKRPATETYEVSFEAVFNGDFNIFEIKDVILPHTGRYQVKLDLGSGKESKLIPETIVYVKNEF